MRYLGTANHRFRLFSPRVVLPEAKHGFVCRKTPPELRNGKGVVKNLKDSRVNRGLTAAVETVRRLGSLVRFALFNRRRED